MKKFNFLEIDGRLLQLFLIVFEEQSVTKAAERLNLTQSAVSHGLEKLRQIVKDPLFVRSGRGITATHRAELMVEDVRGLLHDMRSLSESKEFEIGSVTGKFVVAANDLMWGFLLSDLYHEARNQAPNLDLGIMNAGVDPASLLREGRCDLVLTPITPDASEFKQQKLFKDEFVCFFDPEFTTAPRTLGDYLSRNHARIVFSSVETNSIDQLLASMGKSRRVSLQVPSFLGLSELMKGTDIIAVLPASMKRSMMQVFDIAPCPLPIEPFEVYQIWHKRDDHRPLHQWVRRCLSNISLKL